MELKKNDVDTSKMEMRNQARAYLLTTPDCSPGDVANISSNGLNEGKWYLYQESLQHGFLVCILQTIKKGPDNLLHITYFYYKIHGPNMSEIVRMRVVDERVGEDWIFGLYEIKGLYGGGKFMNWDRNPLNS